MVFFVRNTVKPKASPTRAGLGTGTCKTLVDSFLRKQHGGLHRQLAETNVEHGPELGGQQPRAGVVRFGVGHGAEEATARLKGGVAARTGGEIAAQAQAQAYGSLGAGDHRSSGQQGQRG